MTPPQDAHVPGASDAPQELQKRPDASAPQAGHVWEPRGIASSDKKVAAGERRKAYQIYRCSLATRDEPDLKPV
jgi:hypothetical protein